MTGKIWATFCTGTNAMTQKTTETLATKVMPAMLGMTIMTIVAASSEDSATACKSAQKYTKLANYETLPRQPSIVHVDVEADFHENVRTVYARTLFVRHCAFCHGRTGNGRGPFASFMTPRPRNFRRKVQAGYDAKRRTE